MLPNTAPQSAPDGPVDTVFEAAPSDPQTADPPPSDKPAEAASTVLAHRPAPPDDAEVRPSRPGTDDATMESAESERPVAASTDEHAAFDHAEHEASPDAEMPVLAPFERMDDDAAPDAFGALLDVSSPDGVQDLHPEPAHRADGPTPSLDPAAARMAPSVPLRSAMPLPWLATLTPLLDALPTPTPEASLDVDLGEDGQLSIRASREDGRLAVTVHLSDPSVRATARVEADAIRERLEQHYGTDVDLSFSQDGGRDTHRAFQDASPFASRPGPSSAHPASSSAPTAAPRRGWIG